MIKPAKMKMIGFVHVITRTRCSKKYLNEIGVIGKRVALITSPMTRLFGRSHMRVSGYKMKKKRCVGKWCIISGQLEIYKGGIFYKISLKNCTIKPRNTKIKFKSFLFLIYKTMKKCFYSIGAEYLVLPKRLGTLVQFYGKPVKSMLEYDPSKVDDKWGNVGRIYYVGENVKQKNFEGTIYSDYETAEKLRDENTRKAIGRVMQEKGYTIKQFDQYDGKIKELEGQIDELKNLPPIEIEKIENKFDEPQNENLTIQRKRGRSNWEK